MLILSQDQEKHLVLIFNTLNEYCCHQNHVAKEDPHVKLRWYKKQEEIYDFSKKNYRMLASFVKNAYEYFTNSFQCGIVEVVSSNARSEIGRAIHSWLCYFYQPNLFDNINFDLLFDTGEQCLNGQRLMGHSNGHFSSETFPNDPVQSDQVGKDLILLILLIVFIYRKFNQLFSEVIIVAIEPSWKFFSEFEREIDTRVSHQNFFSFVVTELMQQQQENERISRELTDLTTRLEAETIICQQQPPPVVFSNITVETLNKSKSPELIQSIVPVDKSHTKTNGQFFSFLPVETPAQTALQEPKQPFKSKTETSNTAVVSNAPISLCSASLSVLPSAPPMLTRPAKKRRAKGKLKLSKTKARPTCPACNKVFANAYKMERHSFVHKDRSEKPLQCTWTNCGYRSISNNDLKRHLLTHTGLKPCVCSFEGCSKRYSRPDKLRQHQISFHGINISRRNSRSTGSVNNPDNGSKHDSQSQDALNMSANSTATSTVVSTSASIVSPTATIESLLIKESIIPSSSTPQPEMLMAGNIGSAQLHPNDQHLVILGQHQQSQQADLLNSTLPRISVETLPDTNSILQNSVPSQLMESHNLPISFISADQLTNLHLTNGNDHSATIGQNQILQSSQLSSPASTPQPTVSQQQLQQPQQTQQINDLVTLDLNLLNQHVDQQQQHHSQNVSTEAQRPLTGNELDNLHLQVSQANTQAQRPLTSSELDNLHLQVSSDGSQIILFRSMHPNDGAEPGNKTNIDGLSGAGEFS